MSEERLHCGLATQSDSGYGMYHFTENSDLCIFSIRWFQSRTMLTKSATISVRNISRVATVAFIMTTQYTICEVGTKILHTVYIRPTQSFM